MVLKQHPEPVGRRELQKEKVKSRILRAAETLLSDSSASLTVDDLARVADVSKRTVFNYFDSLETIFVQVASSRLEKFLIVASRQVFKENTEGEFAAIIDAIQPLLVSQALRTEIINILCFNCAYKKQNGSSSQAVFEVAMRDFAESYVLTAVLQTGAKISARTTLFATSLYAVISTSIDLWITQALWPEMAAKQQETREYRSFRRRLSTEEWLDEKTIKTLQSKKSLQLWESLVAEALETLRYGFSAKQTGN